VQSSTHFVIGASLCRYTRWRPLGLALALVSHLALDALPHFEDPSILPRWLADRVGPVWGFVLGLDQLLVAGLVLVTWLHFSPPERGNRSFAAYLIAGGLLACMLDYLSTLMGRGSAAALLNGWPHVWWFVPYLHAVRRQVEWRPAIAAACLLLESSVFITGLWLLFRGARRPGCGGQVLDGGADTTTP